MHSRLAISPDALALVCQRRGVRRLELFGSAVGAGFDPARSDIDLIVHFDDRAQPQLFEHYFGLKQDVEALLGRDVDLVMPGAMRSPHFIRSVESTRELLYASPQPKAA